MKNKEESEKVKIKNRKWIWFLVAVIAVTLQAILVIKNIQSIFWYIAIMLPTVLLIISMNKLFEIELDSYVKIFREE